MKELLVATVTMVVWKPYYTIGGSLLNVSFTLMVSCLVVWFPCVELSDCFPVLNSVTVSLCWAQWLYWDTPPQSLSSFWCSTTIELSWSPLQRTLD